MNPYTTYLFFKRTLRAFKVIFLLIRRRDLARELPSSYLKDMAKSNHWFQFQMVGLVAIVLVPLSLLMPESIAEDVFLWSVLVGFLALLTNMARHGVHFIKRR